MRILLLVLFFSFAAHGMAALPPEQTIEIKNKIFSLYANKEFQAGDQNIEHAIITIHGSARNADTYFKSVWGLSKKLNVEAKTLVLSPHFKIPGDDLLQNELRFSYEGWWIGDQSLDSAKLSSFAVIDFFITFLADQKLFPNLKTLTITGHSAGGHLTQRLALGSQADIGIHHLDIRYVVANPGTYAYLTAKRPVLGQGGVFAIPSHPKCAYNDYKYGMDHRNIYMNKDSVAHMAQRFIKRQVIYLLGEQDRGEVEQSCPAQYQGPYRYARGLNFKAHVDEEYPANIHSLITVPGVGHTQYGMYTSERGKKLLFNLH